MPGVGPTLCFLTLLLPCAAAAEKGDALARVEARFERSGEFTRCISRHRVYSTRVIDGQHILFRLGVKSYFLNRLPRACNALRFNDALLIDSRSPRLCDVDWVRTIRSGLGAGFIGPACPLGRFERLEPRSEHPAEAPRTREAPVAPDLS